MYTEKSAVSSVLTSDSKDIDLSQEDSRFQGYAAFSLTEKDFQITKIRREKKQSHIHAMQRQPQEHTLIQIIFPTVHACSRFCNLQRYFFECISTSLTATNRPQEEIHFLFDT